MKENNRHLLKLFHFGADSQWLLLWLWRSAFYQAYYQQNSTTPGGSTDS